MTRRETTHNARNLVLAWSAAAMLGFAGTGSASEPGAPARTNADTMPSPAPESPAAAPLKSDVSALIDVLQKKYVNPSEVDYKKMDRLAVQGIVAGLGPGAEMPDASSSRGGSGTNEPVVARSEAVDPLIGYVRLTTVNADATKRIDEALAKLDAAKIDSLVLDLRFAQGGTYDGAADLVSEFVLKGKPLFAVRTSQASNATTYATSRTSAYIDWKVAILVNGQTEGPAEVAAAALRELGRGIIVGSRTAGKAVAWSDETLPSGAKVRIATGKVVLSNGTELFPKGVTPDVPVDVKPDFERKLLFEVSKGKPMREFVEQAQTEKRLNEAALVKMLGKEGTNGPVEATEEAASLSTTEKKAAPPVDATLQRAVDILKGIRILHLD